MLFTLLLFKNSIEKFGYLFVHSSTFSCILKLGENRTLRCENSENLSLITLNSVWLTVVQKTFVFKFEKGDLRKGASRHTQTVYMII